MQGKLWLSTVIGCAALGLAVLRRRSKFSFRDRVVLITGARGLGLELARGLAEEGARLALVARDAEELSRAEAGIIQVGPALHMNDSDFEAALAVHFWGPLHAITAVVPQMRKQGGGRIVNIASVGGKVGVPHLAPYSASKFALVGLSDALRAELRPLGIRVTTVAPTFSAEGARM